MSTIAGNLARSSRPITAAQPWRSTTLQIFSTWVLAQSDMVWHGACGDSLA